MKRTALTYLMQWLQTPHRKPLIIRGARQVGKTWLVRAFAALHGKQLIELNFEKNPPLKSLFNSNDPKQILINLERNYNTTIEPDKSVLFLDEIQAAPELLSKLRWFAEDCPELPVIAAGSLLDFVLDEHSFSMPVGRITYMHLEPLSFEEFLQAQGYEKLYTLIAAFQSEDEIPLLIHEQLLTLFKEYCIIGGMPAAVTAWIDTHSLSQVNQIHHDLLATYRDDFSKYAGKISVARLEETLVATAYMLGRKFVYTEVNKDVQAATIKKALDLLSQAKVCHPVHCSAANGIPLAAEIKQKSFKMIFLDTGLACAMLNLKLHQMTDVRGLSLVNQGGISEQVVGQLLRTLEPFYIAPSLYYWKREQKGSAAEIDYLIQHQTHVLPIEVKSGSTGSLKSLHTFMALKKLSASVRINADLPSITSVQVKTQNGDPVSYQLLSIPFYLVGQLHRLLHS